MQLKKLSFTLLTADDDSSKAIGEYIQSALETAFGKQVSAKVQSLPTKSQFAKRTAAILKPASAAGMLTSLTRFHSWTA
ncbi:hypothetical protein ACXO21_06840 [Lactobacillus delbrueckii subsp. bulgaricus]